MRLTDALILLAFAGLLAAVGYAIHGTGRAHLPRHSDAVDLPWSALPDARTDVQETANLNLSDKMNLALPDQSFTSSEIYVGHAPEWNPLIFGGVSHAGNPLTAVFYPPNWLLLVADRGDRLPLDGMLLQGLLHTLLAFVFTYALARRLSLGPAAAALAGFGFALGGWWAAHLHNAAIVGTLCWLPLALWAIETRIRKGGRFPVFVLAIAFAMCGLAGFPQLAFYAILACALYTVVALLCGVRAEGFPRVGRSATSILLFAVLGVAMTAVQLVPSLELKAVSGRTASSVEAAAQGRFHAEGSLGLFLPLTLGNPHHRGRWDEDAGTRFLLGKAPSGAVPPVMNWGERTLYLGPLLVLLALFGCFTRRFARALPLMLLGGIGVALAAVPAVIRTVHGWPGFDTGSPIRAVGLLAFALPLLAAFGVQAVIDGARIRKPLAALVLLLALVLGSLGLWFTFGAESAHESLVDVIEGSARLADFGHGDTPRDRLSQAFEGLSERLGSDLQRAGVLCLLGGLLLLWGTRKAMLLLALLVGLDLGAHLAHVNRPTLREGLFRETPAISHLIAEQGENRLMRVFSDASEANRLQERFFVPNLPGIYGLKDVQGWRELVPARTLAPWEELVVASKPGTAISGILPDRFEHIWLDMLRVEHLLAPAPIAALAEHRVPIPGAVSGDLIVYRNPGTFPVGWMVPRAISLPDADAWKEIHAGRIDPKRTVVIDRWPAGVEKRMADEEAELPSVRYSERTPIDLRFELASPSSGFLVVGDSWAPGWEAEVELASGERVSAEVVRAFGSLRAVALPEGSKAVRMTYAPGSIELGLAITLLALIGLLISPLIRWRLHGHGQTPGGPPAGPAPAGLPGLPDLNAPAPTLPATSPPQGAPRDEPTPSLPLAKPNEPPRP